MLIQRLTLVLDLLQEATWTRGYQARDFELACVSPTDPSARRWCLEGAIRKVASLDPDPQATVALLTEALYFELRKTSATATLNTVNDRQGLAAARDLVQRTLDSHQEGTPMEHPTWKLWLDDQYDDPELPARHPPEGYKPARSTEEAKQLVIEFGWPSHLGLDHDLGGDDKAMHFLNWFIERFPDGPVPEWTIHSENMVGAANLNSKLDSWRRSLKD